MKTPTQDLAFRSTTDLSQFAKSAANSFGEVRKKAMSRMKISSKTFIPPSPRKDAPIAATPVLSHPSPPDADNLSRTSTAAESTKVPEPEEAAKVRQFPRPTGNYYGHLIEHDLTKAQLRQALIKVNDQLSAMNDELSELRLRYANHDADNAELAARNGELETKLARCEDRIEDLQEKASYDEARIQALEHQNAEYRKRIKVYREEPVRIRDFFPRWNK